MGLANCPECGKLYVQTNINLCPQCWATEQEAADRVMEYLRDCVTKATLEEIHQATGVQHKVILRLIKAGRIISDVDVSYPCESCGEPIMEGRLCDKCSQNIAHQLVGMDERLKAKRDREEEDRRKGGRMYSKD
ncbi:MAG TPA: flagellar protein [Patescibacteria group bacterium]|nr:flagellar protein [Patescibacteria group bacterium]